MRKGLFALAITASIANGEVVVLTEDNFKLKTAGKLVFIKFFAPWCGHCKAMVPAWERLAEDWADHDVAVIATIDCTQEHGLCEDFEVTGYPTLYFGNPLSPELYDGGRDYDSLSTFAKENLGKAYCSVYSTTSCSADEKKAIAEFEAKSIDDLAKFVAEVEEKAEGEEELFDLASEALQNTYEKMVEDFNEKVEILKAESNYHLAKAVLMKKDDESSAVDAGSEGGEL